MIRRTRAARLADRAVDGIHREKKPGTWPG